jgi:hypothetical protein
LITIFAVDANKKPNSKRIKRLLRDADGQGNEVPVDRGPAIHFHTGNEVNGDPFWHLAAHG